ncbi:MAG: 50S ribosomal protein L17 [Phycisphaerales bacterium]|nr:MAG: 50S ribosomal protein L17 [Phycisphaerales bacterium]
MALRRNMAQSLIEHGRITTTIAKAKDIRPFVERLVTLAVKVRRAAASEDKAAALRGRRAIHKLIGDRAIIPADHRTAYEDMSDAARSNTLRMASGRRHRTGEPKGRLVFTAESVMHRLIEGIGSRFADRPGGYTRLIRLSNRRLGDRSSLAMVQLVGDEEAPTSLTKPGKSARQRRADARYSMAIRSAKAWSRKDQPPSEQAEPQAEAEPADSAGEEENTDE